MIKRSLLFITSVLLNSTIAAPVDYIHCKAQGDEAYDFEIKKGPLSLNGNPLTQFTQIRTADRDSPLYKQYISNYFNPLTYFKTSDRNADGYYKLYSAEGRVDFYLALAQMLLVGEHFDAKGKATGKGFFRVIDLADSQTSSEKFNCTFNNKELARKSLGSLMDQFQIVSGQKLINMELTTRNGKQSCDADPRPDRSRSGSWVKYTSVNVVKNFRGETGEYVETIEVLASKDPVYECKEQNFVVVPGNPRPPSNPILLGYEWGGSCWIQRSGFADKLGKYKFAIVLDNGVTSKIPLGCSEF